MDLYEKTKERLIRYAKINTRSDEHSNATPSTDRQFDLLHVLFKELDSIGMEDIELDPVSAYVTATLPSNVEKDVPTIGFIAHVDTADFNSENVQPQVIENYGGNEIILNEAEGLKMTPDEFPNLSNYIGQTLITTDGSTLLGADDKAGIAEIMTAMEYLIENPDIKHGRVRVGFGPDEEIGRGADKFNAQSFNTDFAYTIDGGPVGELEYESFNAAGARLKVTGKNIHPGTAKGKMINAVQVLNQFINELPADEVPEKTEGREGFYHVSSIQATEDGGELSMIIRDHDKEKFHDRKNVVQAAVDAVNKQYPTEPIELHMFDQYYNMAEIIEKDMTPVDLAEKAMKELGITPNMSPIRGGTDGSKISFMGIPTPNIFSGAENMHGRFEYVAVESLMKATQVITKIIQLNAI